MDFQKIAGNIPVSQISSKLSSCAPISKAASADSFSAGENVVRILNAKLKSVYGIESNIENKTLLGKIFAAVQDFCRINGEDKLFQDLKISTDTIYSGDLCKTSRMGSSYELIFNKNADWKNIASITKEAFQKGKTGSKNPNYFIYKNLGDFLCFSKNPESYRECRLMSYEGENMTLPFRICSNTDMQEFNSHAIASKMCGETLPADIEEYFRKNTGLNIKFSETINKLLEGSKISFDTTEDAVKFLKQYGIEAEFSDIKQASCFA